MPIGKRQYEENAVRYIRDGIPNEAIMLRRQKGSDL